MRRVPYVLAGIVFVYFGLVFVAPQLAANPLVALAGKLASVTLGVFVLVSFALMTMDYWRVIKVGRAFKPVELAFDMLPPLDIEKGVMEILEAPRGIPQEEALDLIQLTRVSLETRATARESVATACKLAAQVFDDPRSMRGRTRETITACRLATRHALDAAQRSAELHTRCRQARLRNSTPFAPPMPPRYGESLN